MHTIKACHTDPLFAQAHVFPRVCTRCPRARANGKERSSGRSSPEPRFCFFEVFFKGTWFLFWWAFKGHPMVDSCVTNRWAMGSTTPESPFVLVAGGTGTWRRPEPKLANRGASVDSSSTSTLVCQFVCVCVLLMPLQVGLRENHKDIRRAPSRNAKE